MKSNRLLPLVILLAGACAGGGPRPAGDAAAGAKTAPDAKTAEAKPADAKPADAKPAPTPATPAPATTSDAAGFPLSPQEKAQQEEKQRKFDELTKRLESERQTPTASGEGEIVVNPKTGRKEQRIEKSVVTYRASGGRLYLAMLGDLNGFPILHEDEKAWYIPAPTPRKVKPESEKQVEEALPLRTVPLPAEEAELVAPRRTTEKLHLQEMSEGLPTGGMWRENIALADLDGDGRPEIVSPPPRLSGREMQIFKWDGRRWTQPTVTFDDPEKVGFEYGGVACADMDGDGKVDIVYGRHGGGPAIAFNKGGFRFRVETRGLPRLMTTRALAIGDIDGDGHPDVLALSDDPEWVQVRRAEAEGNVTARLPRADGYLPGFDTRAFLWRDGRYVENHAGLEESCYGYSLAFAAKPVDGKDPFYVSACRYNGNPGVVFSFDRAAQRFVRYTWQAGELHALHIGSATGVYQGHPAAVVSYSKSTPEGGTPSISGYGVSIYYRDGETWKRKRVVKALQEPVLSQGLAVGDLNGDGLDDVVFGDEGQGRVRVFLQRANGDFEEIAAELEPTFTNHITSMRIGDVDGDGRPDIVFAYQPLSSDPTRAGGLRVLRNVR